MTTVAPSPIAATSNYAVRAAHLVTLVQQVSRRSHSRAIAVYVPGPWTGGGELVVDARRWRVVQANSVLTAREALSDLEADDPDARLVIVTALAEKELGLDVLARVAKQRVWPVQSWELLRDLFHARAVDPRVASLRWLADVLLEQAPLGGYPPVASGVLDLETAWTKVLGLLLTMPTGAPDSLTLLRWSTDERAASRWTTLPDEVRRGVAERMAETAGSLGAAFAAAANAGYATRLLALGAVLDVLWPRTPPVDAALRDIIAAARVRLEPIVGGRPLPDQVAREWAALSNRVLTELGPEDGRRLRDAAEALLQELRAGDAVVLSQNLPAAASLRAAQFARAIRAVLTNEGSLDEVMTAHASFVAHTDVARDSDRVVRATMALRLIRALNAPAVGEPGSFGVAARLHVEHSSWFDAARTTLLGGEVTAELADAYAEMLMGARAQRELQSHSFARRLVAWNTHPTAEAGVVPIEQVLELVVRPIAEVRPVLVVLVDGLDFIVWRQLHDDLAARGWTWWQPSAAPIVPVAIATLPSITAASRASLFAGVVKSGSQQTEAPDFTHHPALRGIGGRPPVLFHKGDLGAGNSLASEIRGAIDDTHQRVIGVVINAVDDWLDRSGQVLPRWSVTAIPLLEALLQEAGASSRAVVILSDHGHLLDYRTTSRGVVGDGSRWRRVTSGAAVDGEIVAAGSRVRAATGDDEIVVAWSEALRYIGKKTGYHGGAAPQEVVAPIAVLSRDELGLEGWRPVVDSPPEWWDVDETSGQVRAQAAERIQRRKQGTAPAVTIVEPSPIATWIDTLLLSPAYKAQRDLAGRTALRDEQMRVMLQTLDRFQGRAPRAAVGADLGLPDVRVRGVLAGARRVLNVEGFGVIEEDDATSTVLLNRELLYVQFGLGA